MSTRPKLLGIAGSLRKDSHNLAVLKTIKAQIAERADLEIFALHDLPLYNQDIDIEQPPLAVGNLRSAIGMADGVIIATPEYNYGIPGLLKNALDWASRPYGRATLPGKPVLTLSASPAFTGGVRAQAQLNETLLAIGAELLSRPQIVIGTVHERVREGRLEDEATLGHISTAVDALLVKIGVTKARPAVNEGAVQAGRCLPTRHCHSI